MKKLFLIAPVAVLMGGCATSRIENYPIEKPSLPHSKVLILMSIGNEDFEEMNQTVYEENFHEPLYDIDYRSLNEQLQKAIKRNLQSPGTEFEISASTFSDVNQKLSYSDFQEKIEEIDPTALLIVNISKTWISQTIVDGTSHDWQNAIYKSYLYDNEEEKIIWLSRARMSGRLGLRALNKKLARNLLRSLASEKFIFTPKYGTN